MSSKLRSQQGFTLIELLIVVAIIGILAAIAIPQFAKYRIQGFNASANTDLRNLKTSEESLYAEYQRYGATDFPATLAAASGSATGALITGGTTGGVPVVTLTDAVGTARGLPIPVGNNITIAAVGIATTFTAYNGVAKHTNGDTLYGVDSDSTINYKYKNWPTAATAVGAPATLAVVPVPVADTVDFTLSATTWAQM